MKIVYVNAFDKIYKSHINWMDVRYGSPLTEEQKRLNELQEEMKNNSSHFDCGKKFWSKSCCGSNYSDYIVYTIIKESDYYL